MLFLIAVRLHTILRNDQVLFPTCESATTIVQYPREVSLLLLLIMKIHDMSCNFGILIKINRKESTGNFNPQATKGEVVSTPLRCFAYHTCCLWDKILIF